MESFLAELPTWARTLFYIFAVLFASGLFVYGKLQPPKGQGRRDMQGDKTYELAGALVDSASIKMLSAALEARNVLLVQARADDEKSRRLGHDLVKSLDALSRELSAGGQLVKIVERQAVTMEGLLKFLTDREQREREEEHERLRHEVAELKRQQARP